MTVVLSSLILIAPFVVAAAFSWATHRSDGLRVRVDDRDAFRVQHDLDAIRTRFERSPIWPASGATGERR